MNITAQLCYIASLICFILAWFGVSGNWQPAGFVFLAAGHVLG